MQNMKGTREKFEFLGELELQARVYLSGFEFS